MVTSHLQCNTTTDCLCLYGQCIERVFLCLNKGTFQKKSPNYKRYLIQVLNNPDCIRKNGLIEKNKRLNLNNYKMNWNQQIMIKGCVGFSYCSGRLFGDMLIVRGKRCISVPLPYPIYLLMARLWKRKNILGKILFSKPGFEVELERAKRLSS